MFSDEELERLWASEPKQQDGESMSDYMLRYSQWYGNTFAYQTPARKLAASEIKHTIIHDTKEAA